MEIFDENFSMQLSASNPETLFFYPKIEVHAPKIGHQIGVLG